MFSFSPREKVSRDATDEGLALHAVGARPSPVCSAATPRSLAKHSASPPLRARGSTPREREKVRGVRQKILDVFGGAW